MTVSFRLSVCLSGEVTPASKVTHFSHVLQSSDLSSFDELIMAEYLLLMKNLVSAHTFYLGACMKMIVDNFRPSMLWCLLTCLSVKTAEESGRCSHWLTSAFLLCSYTALGRVLCVTLAHAEQLENIQKHAIRMIFTFIREISYSYALFGANLISLNSRCHDLSKLFFQDICSPSFCIHLLLHPYTTPLFYPGSEQSRLSHA